MAIIALSFGCRFGDPGEAKSLPKTPKTTSQEPKMPPERLQGDLRFKNADVMNIMDLQMQNLSV